MEEITKGIKEVSTSSTPTASKSEIVSLNNQELLAFLKNDANLKERERVQKILQKRASKEDENRVFKFWGTQPMLGLKDTFTAGDIEGPINANENVADVKQEPYNMPAGFEWSSLDLKDDNVVNEIYKLLYENYVEDDEGGFRFDYSKDFLRWALTPPHYVKDWHVGVRNQKTGTLMGIITAIPASIMTNTFQRKMVEINFLCVHKKLRSKRLAPVLIKEVTRRVNLHNIWQAVYTAGVLLPKPVSKCKYYHRSLNPKKLIDIRFSSLPHKKTLKSLINELKLPAAPEHRFQPMKPSDVEGVHTLLNTYLKDSKLHQEFSIEEVAHIFLPIANVIETYVLYNEDKLTDFCSFYHLPSTVLNNDKYNDLKAVYSYYNVPTTMTFEELMRDSLILARESGADVFNCLNLSDNMKFIPKLQFLAGDGNLNYYIFNWKSAEIEPHEIDIMSNKEFDNLQEVKNKLNWNHDEVSQKDLYDKLRDITEIGKNKAYVLHRDIPHSEQVPISSNSSNSNILNLNYVENVPLEYRDFKQLPEEIYSSIVSDANVRDKPFMGILSEIERVWIAVHNSQEKVSSTLFLWDYNNLSNDLVPYETVHFDSQITAVAISAPKASVFLDNVEYVLIVTTVLEAAIYAIIPCPEQNRLMYVTTPFNASMEDDLIVKIVGTQCGRIFIGCINGSIFEIEYSNGDYGDYNWTSLLIPNTDAVDSIIQKRKCRKIRHSNWFKNLLLFTLSDNNDKLADMCVDNIRNILYVITEKGDLDVFYLGEDAESTTHVVSLKSHNLFSMIKVIPRHSFGDNSKLDDSLLKTISSLHVIPITESQKVHLMILLRNGVRVYVSLLNRDKNYFYSFFPSTINTNVLPPASIDIPYIRFPPTPTAFQWCHPRATAPFYADDAQPALVTGSGKTDHAFYAHGILFSSTHVGDRDELMCIFDHVSRKDGTESEFSIREGLCAVGARVSSDGIEIDSYESFNEVFDIKESVSQIHCPELSKTINLFASSRGLSVQDPPPIDTTRGGSSLMPAWMLADTNEPTKQSLAPAVYFNAITAPIRTANDKACRCTKSDIKNSIIVKELNMQLLPVLNYSTQRKFLCLRKNGVYVYAKNRPVDDLYKVLQRLVHEKIKKNYLLDVQLSNFSRHYNGFQLCCMYYSLAAGLPADAGSFDGLYPYSALHSGGSNTDVSAKISTKGIDIIKESKYCDPDWDDSLYGHRTVFSKSTEALRVTVNRIIRPVFLRKVVVVATNGAYELDGIWTGELIEAMKQPLVKLKAILETFTLSTSKKHMLVGSRSSDDGYIQARQTHSDRLSRAQNDEDNEIRSMYRIVDRCIQALYLIEILMEINRQYLVPITWSNLQSMQFWEFALSSKANVVIQKEVMTILGNVYCDPQKMHLAEQLAHDMSAYACMFFSNEDEFKAAKVLIELRQLLIKSVSHHCRDVTLKANEYIDLLKKACKCWCTYDAVNAKLNEKCDFLIDNLGVVGLNGVVDLCFATAECFGGIKSEDTWLAASGTITGTTTTDTGAYAIDEIEKRNTKRLCYDVLLNQIMKQNKAKLDFNYSDDSASYGRRSSSGSGSGGGAETDAEILRRVINRAVGESDDPEFFELLCDRLLHTCEDELVYFTYTRKSSTAPNTKENIVEMFLLSKGRYDLLYKHYTYNQQHGDAARLMRSLAIDGKDIGIHKRVEYLNQAVRSLEMQQSMKSYNQQQQQQATVSSSDLNDLKYMHVVAQCQQQAYDRLEDERSRQQRAISFEYDRYKSSLQCIGSSVDDVIHQLDELKYWDLSLSIIHSKIYTCSIIEEKADMITKYWRSIIYSIVPEAATSNKGKDFLALKNQKGYKFDKPSYSSSSGSSSSNHTVVSFEDTAAWFPSLRFELHRLGCKLVGSDGFFAFPVKPVLRELTEIALMHLHTSTMSRNNSPMYPDVAECILNMHVPKEVVIDAYFSLISEANDDLLLHLLASVSQLLCSWVGGVKTYSTNAVDRRQLLQSIRVGRYSVWLRDLDKTYKACKCRPGQCFLDTAKVLMLLHLIDQHRLEATLGLQYIQEQEQF